MKGCQRIGSWCVLHLNVQYSKELAIFVKTINGKVLDFPYQSETQPKFHLFRETLSVYLASRIEHEIETWN